MPPADPTCQEASAALHAWVLPMFLRQSTCTSQDYYAHMEMTFLPPPNKLEMKMRNFTKLGEDKIKDSSKLKLVIPDTRLGEVSSALR